MDKAVARQIADALTWARIVSIVPITVFAYYDMKWWAFGFYTFGALTDWFDGWFARRAAPPKSDTDLDGIADLLFSFSTLLWLWLLVPGFVSTYWLPYLPIFILLEIYMSVVRIRHQRFGVPHFQFGRFAMALFFFLFPVLLIWGDMPWFVHTVLVIGVASKIQLATAFWRRSH